MPLTLSMHLKQVKSTLQVILIKLQEEFEYVSILATDCFGKNYSVSRSGTSIGTGFTNERGFVIKVYHKGFYSEYAFDYVDQDEIDQVVETVKNNLVSLPEALRSEMELSFYEEVEEEHQAYSKEAEVAIHPRDLGDEAIIKCLTHIHEEGLKVDEKVIECRAGFEYLHVNKLFLSPKKDLEQSFMWSNGIVMCMAAKEEQNKYAYRGFSGMCGAELMDQMEQHKDEVISSAVALLESENIVPGEYDVICTPDISGLIAHEAFGHGVEMDMFVKNRALAQDYIDQYVASPIVTMYDGACAANNSGSFFFDDEGTLAQDTLIIEKGILKQGISDRLTAQKLGTKPTGNGRRESYERKAYTRMTNTYFAPGTDELEDMIASIAYGFLLDEAASGMEDPKNWGIQCMVNIAREIKDGKLTGKVYSPVVLTGYVPDLLKSISMVSKDLELFGAGFCGKGYKEWVKVSSGGPYIKARVRLG